MPIDKSKSLRTEIFERRPVSVSAADNFFARVFTFHLLIYIWPKVRDVIKDYWNATEYEGL